MTAPRVTIVSVLYNSMAVVGRMLASVPPGTPVVLVDNGTDDRSVLRALAKSQGATLIENETNTGFGAGCNLGAAAAGTEFVLFLNPDAELAPGALEALLKAADAHPEAAAFNPVIREANGKSGVRRRSVLVPRSDWQTGPLPDIDFTVPILSGAAFFVRRDRFEAVGGFDDGIFLYHEDDDLSLRLQDRFGPLMVARAAETIHHQGNSSVRTPQSAAFKAWHMGRSRVYTRRKHGHSLPFLSSFGAALWQLGSPDVLFSARKRAKRWALLKGVVSEYSGESPQPDGGNRH
ncbi:MAG: glycosyltransferase family 2 protein [Pseudomonadota bacterium]